MDTMKLVDTVVILGLWYCISVQGFFQEDKITLLQDPNDEKNKTMVVVSRTSEEDNNDDVLQCRIFTDVQLIGEVLKVYEEYKIHRPNKGDMQEILKECTAFSSRRRRRDTSQENDSPLDNSTETTTPSSQSTHSSVWNHIIYPGTKWCGAGNIAKNYSDLGYYKDTDRCCRSHDSCGDYFSGGEEKYNLTNKSSFTKMSCKCDHAFYDCLSRVNSLASDGLGNTYFNILQRDCYKKDYPQTKKCKKYRTVLELSCLEFERNTTAPKVYQWFPAKEFRKLHFKLRITFPWQNRH